MKYLLLFLMTSSQFAFAFPCSLPSFVSYEQQASLIIPTSTAVFVTHSSKHFDPLHLTKNGMNHLVKFAKQEGFSVYYLHDSGNPNNPFEGYMYDDCEPEAYIYSEIGLHRLNTENVDHVYVAGGFFELCENNTVKTAVKNWQKRPGKGHQLKVTQVVESVFAVGEKIFYQDPYHREYYNYFYNDLKKRNSSSSIPLSDIFRIISADNLVVEYIKRHLPQVPLNWNVSIKWRDFEYSMQKTSAEETTLVFEFLSSDDL